MNSKTLLRKPKIDLIKILQEQSEVVTQQSEIIESLQSMQVNIDREIRDRYNQETHLTKVFNNLKVSQERIEMALSVLYPLPQMETTTPQLVISKVIAQANTVIGNELLKITNQQLVEAGNPPIVKK